MDNAAAAKSLQSCPTLCDPIDGSPPGSPVPGILQARTPEWVAISFSNEWKWKVKGKSLIRVRLLATPWTAAHQAPPSMGFSRQEYWSGVPLPSLWIMLTLCKCIFFMMLRFIRECRIGPLKLYNLCATETSMLPYSCGLVIKMCLTLCHPVDCRPPGSSVHGFSQARILQWVAISFFNTALYLFNFFFFIAHVSQESSPLQMLLINFMSLKDRHRRETTVLMF